MNCSQICPVPVCIGQWHKKKMKDNAAGAVIQTEESVHFNLDPKVDDIIEEISGLVIRVELAEFSMAYQSFTKEPNMGSFGRPRPGEPLDHAEVLLVNLLVEEL